MSKKSLTAQTLKESLSYCPESGTFTWIVRKARVTFGKLAACPKTNPVPTIMLHGNSYSVLQLAWLYVHGEFPRSKIIPLNGDRCDARAANLMERAAKSAELTAERLRELLGYNPETGVFTRRIRTSNRIAAGEPAGGPNDDGYIVIRVDGSKYPAHRLAWLYVHGKFPDREIDHINGLRDDNRIANLRDVGRTENTQNTHRLRRPDGSLKGAHKLGNRWAAKINVNKKAISLGAFATPEEAHEAYVAAKRRLHPTSTL